MDTPLSIGAGGSRHRYATAEPVPDRVRLLSSLYWVHRLEYPFSIAYLCAAIWGACWAVSQPRQLLSVPVLAIVVASYSHLVGQNVLNTPLDIDSDTGNPQKRVVATAALRLGRPTLIRLAVVELALPVLIAAAVAIWLSRPAILAWMALTVALQVLYNLEPVRLKRRGMANPITLALTYVALPGIPAYLAVRPALPPVMWLVLLGLLLAGTGRTLYWAVPDREADIARNDVTPVVRLGTVRALVLAIGLAVAGAVLVGAALWWRYGVAAGLVGVAAAGVFPFAKLRRLIRAARGHTVQATRVRRRDLPLALLVDLAVAAIPLAALIR
jgi:4-hydroxybenzoate polyprenyltransferase